MNQIIQLVGWQCPTPITPWNLTSFSQLAGEVLSLLVELREHHAVSGKMDTSNWSEGRTAEGSFADQYHVNVRTDGH